MACGHVQYSPLLKSERISIEFQEKFVLKEVVFLRQSRENLFNEKKMDNKMPVTCPNSKSLIIFTAENLTERQPLEIKTGDLRSQMILSEMLMHQIKPCF